MLHWFLLKIFFNLRSAILHAWYQRLNLYMARVVSCWLHCPPAVSFNIVAILLQTLSGEFVYLINSWSCPLIMPPWKYVVSTPLTFLPLKYTFLSFIYFSVSRCGFKNVISDSVAERGKRSLLLNSSHQDFSRQRGTDSPPLLRWSPNACDWGKNTRFVDLSHCRLRFIIAPTDKSGSTVLLTSRGRKSYEKYHHPIKAAAFHRTWL